jgi:hypothetical protein
MQTVHLSCTDTNTISKWTKTRFHMTQVTKCYIGCVQNDFEPMVRSTQSVHLSCVKISTISKRTESIFHLNLVTMEYHWVCQKWFMSLWYVRCKLCTYLLSRLALFPNGLNRASTWASHLGLPSGASKTISEPMVRLAQTMHLSCVKISTISKRNEMSIHLSLVT